MKVRDIIRGIEKDGWYFVHQVGSHRQFRHPVKPGRTTVAGPLGQDVKIGTLKSILRQAQLRLEDLQ